MKKYYSLFLVILLVFTLVACSQSGKIESKTPVTSSKVEKVSSVSQLKQLFSNNKSSDRYSWEAVDEALTGGNAAPNAESSATSPNSKSSKTNVQVAGVDEADIAKLYNKHLFTIQNRNIYAYYYNSSMADQYKCKINITDISDATNMKIVFSKQYDDFVANEMYVTQDRLILLGQQLITPDQSGQHNSAPGVAAPEIFIEPAFYYASKAMILVYDISDISSPTLIRTSVFDGSINSSRIYNGNIYIVLNQYFNEAAITKKSVGISYSDTIATQGDTKEIAPTDICILPNPTEYIQMFQIASFDIINKDSQLYLDTYVGNSGQIYMNENSLYIAGINYKNQTKEVAVEIYPDGRYYYGKSGRYSVAEPGVVEPAPAKEEVVESRPDQEPYYANTPIQGVTVDPHPYVKPSPTTATYLQTVKSWCETTVSRFALKGGKAQFIATATVQGAILNQFSMDEYNHIFRIAVTENESNYENNNYQQKLSSSVYTFDMDMKLLGSITNIAPEERIYSARFEGNIGYIVTFKQIDPLFTIDLTDPANPKILGELKVPGFSNYLHPYKDGLVVGLGTDTVEQEIADWADKNSTTTVTRQNGMKLTMFDASDKNNPKELFTVKVGKEYATSEAQYNHKALIFDQERGLIGFVISDYSADYSKTRQVFVLYQIDLENKTFNLIAEISHLDPNFSFYNATEKDYIDYQNSMIYRGVYMDNVIYTISNKQIVATDFMTGEKISTLVLP